MTTNAVTFLAENREILMDTYQQNENSPAKTWQKIQETLPGIADTMSENTFKKYITIFAAAYDAMENNRQKMPVQASKPADEIQFLKNKVQVLEKEKSRLDNQLQTANRQITDAEIEKAELKTRLETVTKELDMIQTAQNASFQKDKFFIMPYTSFFFEFISNMTDYFYEQVYSQINLLDAYGIEDGKEKVDNPSGNFLKTK